MKIVKVQAREIFDSRGLPTIECEISLEDGYYVTASVPSGLSKSKYEAQELVDGGKRLMGQGVLKAIESIETIIAPAILGKEPDVVTIDQIMLSLDDSPDKSKIGSNAMLAVSIATLKAQALVESMEPYEVIAQLLGRESVTLPLPIFNMIQGGMHVENKLRIQEFMIVPVGAQNFKQALEYGVEFYHTLKDLLIKDKINVGIGNEGGFVPLLESDEQALDYLVKTIEQLNGSAIFKIAIDVAASHFYDAKSLSYDWYGKTYNTDGLISLYKNLGERYPLCSIEDGLSEDDIEGWAKLTNELGKKVHIIGDDIFATDPNRIYQGIIAHLATGAIIKPDQVGTITETLQSLQLCQEYNFSTIVSHRSGETNDSFIADLAVGASAGQIKAGAPAHGERLAKYNRLLAIEDELALSLMGE